MEWRPATIDAVKEIIETDLAKSDSQQLAAFRQYSVVLFFAPILRNGKLEPVVVVAQRGDEVIYWEDVEEGFNVSQVGRRTSSRALVQPRRVGHCLEPLD